MKNELPTTRTPEKDKGNILKMMGVMGVVVGPKEEEYAVQRDDSRIKQAEIRHAASSKEGRTARRQALAS
ncbi:hypothetical protein EVAR_33569_1 [Eumeta japonica]|uniref:Uncharacterized protein n=1 Tax=Eumeta variegata TaxID=151549 RepID=A0A4C1VI91_EUMVA|nr:hypothetical protein EVAR_33569_1 [Eumeta japonica]